MENVITMDSADAADRISPSLIRIICEIRSELSGLCDLCVNVLILLLV